MKRMGNHSFFISAFLLSINPMIKFIRDGYTYKWVGGGNMKKMVIVVILFFCLEVYSSDNNGILKVSNCFVSSGGKFKQINVVGRGKILSKEKLTDIVVKIYKSYGKRFVYRLSKGKAEIKLIGEDVFITITKLPEENLFYVYFLVSQHDDRSNINNMRRNILKSFSVYSVKPHISYLIIGKYPYKMTLADMGFKAKEIVKTSGAQFINLINDRNLISAIGFLPQLEEKIKIQDNIINLNIALRYNDLDKSTYIWIGCPIISVEY